MLAGVEDYRTGRLPLGRLVSDLRGFFVEAGPHDQVTRNRFEEMWSPLDGQWELRSEPWAPPGAASDEALTSALVEFTAWVRDVLAQEQTSEHR